MKKLNIQPAQLFKIKDSVKKNYHWDTTNYRMLVYDYNGRFVAYDEITKEVSCGTSSVNRRDHELINTPGMKLPDMLIASFEKRDEMFWKNIFALCTQNTGVEINVQLPIVFKTDGNDRTPKEDTSLHGKGYNPNARFENDLKNKLARLSKQTIEDIERQIKNNKNVFSANEVLSYLKDTEQNNLLALEFGFKQAEKGNNLDRAFANYSVLTNTTKS